MSSLLGCCCCCWEIHLTLMKRIVLEMSMAGAKSRRLRAFMEMRDTWQCWALSDRHRITTVTNGRVQRRTVMNPDKCRGRWQRYQSGQWMDVHLSMLMAVSR